MTSKVLDWPAESICLQGGALSEGLVEKVYDLVCRTDFAQPGFCHLDLGSELGSVACRQFMVELVEQLSAMHQARRSVQLAVKSAVRADQQLTTKPHLDGGPAECLLLLAYEPSEVRSQVELADYTRCAHDRSLTPTAFLAEHNPMFRSSLEILAPYTTTIRCFARDRYQLLCINNSSAEFSEESPTWQGVLHTATVHEPDLSKRRVVNSMLVAPVVAGNTMLDAAELADFVSTSRVRRRGYDQPTLSDDP